MLSPKPPSGAESELTLIDTEVPLSVTLVTRVHVSGPVTVPTTTVWSSRTR